MLALVKMLMGLVALILIIACSNVANLLLARGRAPQPRGRHPAIHRSAAQPRGAPTDDRESDGGDSGRRRGAVFAYGGILLLETLSVPSDPPNVLGVQLDWRVVEFSMLAALGSCIFFGLAPAWQTARTDFVSALKTRRDTARRARGARSGATFW
jgi:putative ABC transport system permease protein